MVTNFELSSDLFTPFFVVVHWVWSLLTVLESCDWPIIQLCRHIQMAERKSNRSNPCRCFQVEHPFIFCCLTDGIASIHVLSDLKIFISSSDHLRSLNQFRANFLSFTNERVMFPLCIHPYYGTEHEIIIFGDAWRRKLWPITVCLCALFSDLCIDTRSIRYRNYRYANIGLIHLCFWSDDTRYLVRFLITFLIELHP